jgi:CDP-diglyceride synthetase
MKGYLTTTGLLFALLALAHVMRTIAEWSRLTTDPGFIVEGPGIGLVAAALCFWAWRLLRVSARPQL